MEIKDTEVSLNTTEFELFKKGKLVFGKKLEDVKEDTLFLDKSVTVIFGKNGSGKSTLSKRIKETFGDECYLFNGFDGVVGEKKELNAVVLGAKNNEIEEQIKQEEAKINEIEKAIKEINRELEEFDENGIPIEDNLFAKRQGATEVYNNQDAKIDKFYRENASKITKDGLTQPGTRYDKNAFKEEIKTAKRLSNEERNNNKELLKNSTKRTASLLPTIDFDPKNLSDTVNGILKKSVKEKIIIKRLKDNPKKQRFAREGFDIHKPGEVCAFCGHEIEDSVFVELKAYFSDEVEAFEKEIEDEISKVGTLRDSIDKMKIVVENFYPQFQTKIGELCGRFDKEKLKILPFLNACSGELENKKGNLFKPSELLKNEIETDFSNIIGEYNEATKENNAIDVSSEREKAMRALRLDKVLELCNKGKYEAEMQKLEDLKKRKTEAEDAFRKKEEEKQGKEKEKAGILEEIGKLRAQTEDVSILAQHINNKLRGYVSFVLEYVGDREKKDGNYKIKDEGGYRDVTTLSAGEKNIIAFLYFLEKLNEADQREQRNKIIVFDDPMNSNDDAMQYVMTEELRRLCKERKEDYTVIMTHNGHFYINLLHDCVCDKQVKNKVKRIHLKKLPGNSVEFNIIEKEEDDIKTCYQGLWLDLRAIYECEEASPRLLLNPMRRIIETYVMFAGISKKDFYDRAPVGLKKLLDFNQHGLDDLEYEVGCEDKGTLMQLFEEAFQKNGAEAHFACYWKFDNGKSGKEQKHSD